MDKSVKERIVEFAKAKQITVREFERRCGLSNGYVNAMRKGLGTEKLNNVLTAYPDLNRDWLVYGEGPMLSPVPDDSAASVSSIVNGPHGTQAVGDGARAVNGEGAGKCLEKSLEIIREQQETIRRQAETINRLVEKLG